MLMNGAERSMSDFPEQNVSFQEGTDINAGLPWFTPSFACTVTIVCRVFGGSNVVLELESGCFLLFHKP